MQQDDIILNGPALASAFRRQLRIWLWLGPLVGGLMLLAALTLIPRSYTALTSVAIQQPSSGSSILSGIIGGGSDSKRYIGVLKSRDLAQQVERHVQLYSRYGRFYDLKSEDDAIDLLTKSIKPDDSTTDGLLYINVTLKGPPRLSFYTSPSPDQVKDASVLAANSYAQALKEYYITSDTDQGSVLLRGAASEVKQARDDYEASLAQIMAFSRGLKNVDPRSMPSLSLEGSDSSPAMSGLVTLFTALAQVQAELKSAQAARQTRQELTSKLLRDLPNVPVDDPLLATIRSQVQQDHANYETASQLFGPENPDVIKARTQLQVDQAELQRQIQGIKQNLTTPNIRSDEEIQSLYARQAILTKQIASEEHHLGMNRELSGQMGTLQAEVTIRLEVLKTTMAEAAKVRLDNASLASRMFIVDKAVPPEGNGEPKISKVALICLALVLIAFGVAVVREYMRLARAARLAMIPMDSTANGSGMRSIEETEEAALPLTRKR